MAPTNVPDEKAEGSGTSKNEYGRGIVLKDGYSLLAPIWEVQEQIRTYNVNPGDVWVATFPKSGTTWTQELTWMLTHNLDFEAAKTLLQYRSPPSIESALCANLRRKDDPKSLNEFEEAASLSGSRRVIKTHLPWELLPDKLRDPSSKGKIIHVTRNPKDVCISYYYYHFLRSSTFGTQGPTVEEFCAIFMSDRIMYGPYWNYIQGFWNQRDNPNILFLKFEEMKKDLEKVVQKVASFLEVPVPTGEQMTRFLDHLSFENMKKNPAVNAENSLPGKEELKTDNPEIGKFFRKGAVGDGRKKMSPEMVKEFDEWIKLNAERIGMPWEDLL